MHFVILGLGTAVGGWFIWLRPVSEGTVKGTVGSYAWRVQRAFPNALTFQALVHSKPVISVFGRTGYDRAGEWIPVGSPQEREELARGLALEKAAAMANTLAGLRTA